MLKLSILFSLLPFTSILAQEKDTIISVYFENNSYTLDDKQKSDLLNTLFSTSCIYEISGFTDTVGTSDYNKLLAQRRVTNILDLIKEAHLCTNGKLLAMGETSQFGNLLNSNRRVEIKALFTCEKPRQTFILKNIVLDYIHFLPDSYILTPESFDYIDQLFLELNRYKSEKFELIGHVNYQSTSDSNHLSDTYRLSENRAKTVADLLIEKGISASRIIYKGVGNLKPIFPNPINEEEKRQNMYVEVNILEIK